MEKNQKNGFFSDPLKLYAAYFSAPLSGRREVSGIRLGDSRAERQRGEAQGTILKLGLRKEAGL